MATSVLLVRHGESTWNASGRWQGQADPPLSALGVRQARAAAERVGTVDVVIASDLLRAAATAAIIAAAIGIGPVIADPTWRERRAGAWTGHTRAEIEARWPGHLAARTWPEGWEHDDELVGRGRRALAAAAALAPGGSVLVVSHGGLIRSLEHHLGGERAAPLANLEGRVVVVEGDRLALGSRQLLLDDTLVTVTRPANVER